MQIRLATANLQKIRSDSQEYLVQAHIAARNSSKTQSAFHRRARWIAFRHRARQRFRCWRRCLRQLSMALHVRDVAAERGIAVCEVDAKHIVFEDGVSRR